MIKNLLKNNFWLFIILILAFGLRLYKVTSVPPSLNWDETSIGYNAYSILKTGKDEWGEFMPLHFRSFGEYKLPAQIYASIPGIYFFGLNELGVRITPVVYGTLTVLLLYFLVYEIFKKREIALISSFLLAVSPWHIQLTRGSFESSFSLFWFVMAVWFLVKGFKKPIWFIVSMIPFAISVYTYNTARVFTPFFLLVYYLLNIKFLFKNFKYMVLSTLAFVVLLIPLIPFVLSGEASARYKLVSITDDAGLIPRIEERRNLSKLPPLVTKLIHNRYTYNTYYFSVNYLSHFTPDFLFVNGAGHRQHHVQGVGELYWIQAPFLLYGLYLLLKRKDWSLKVLLPWLLLAFVPVSMTNDSIPNALRTLIAVPVYQVFTAIGIYYFVKLNNNKKLVKLLLLLAVVLFLINFSIYLKKLYVDYSVNYSRDWQHGNKQVVEYIKENQDDYDLVVYSRVYGEPHIFTLFNLNYDPKKFQEINNLERFETFDWVRVLRFDKYYFPDLGDDGTRYEDIVIDNPDKKILFIGKVGDFPSEVKILERINFLNNETAFEIVTN
ncbi:MAG: glycosyltransferase family 39 protein [bacterium]|nr:MAG: glycosyltransferase family 39 protein [bacterium]